MIYWSDESPKGLPSVITLAYVCVIKLLFFGGLKTWERRCRLVLLNVTKRKSSEHNNSPLNTIILGYSTLITVATNLNRRNAFLVLYSILVAFFVTFPQIFFVPCTILDMIYHRTYAFQVLTDLRWTLTCRLIRSLTKPQYYISKTWPLQSISWHINWVYNKHKAELRGTAPSTNIPKSMLL